MNNKRKQGWNQGSRVKGNQYHKGPTPAEVKFKEVQGKLQAAVKKHIDNYESSSEEEEFETNSIIDKIVKSYTEVSGSSDYLSKTKTYLYDSFAVNTGACLICISKIKRDSSIWTCCECFCMFHLDCIQRWSKDSIYQQKQIMESPIQVSRITLTWGCPKCRHDYRSEDIPEKYLCFCKKSTDPKFQPLLAPHSCGEICGKDLKPMCGHRCLLLCHPGPCPPCPVTISVSCYCNNQPPTYQRCSNKEWSCGKSCGKKLICGRHSCLDICHPGECKPCPKKSLQKCLCKKNQKLRDCASLTWRCDNVCNKALGCGHHTCLIACHGGDCDDCPLTKLRYCPCGKTKYQLPCTEETPTCPDTCDKLLDCGVHKCNQRCHKGACGLCLETVVKSCRCGMNSKAVQCHKLYICESKCKRMKDCNKHACNKKCCDGNCSPCDKICGRSLNCGNHKCSSVCHRGLCFPCHEVDIVSCRCGSTKLNVPCGRKFRTKPPRCSNICRIAPDCHHDTRESHRCHFGDCPSCKQICNKPRTSCTHFCNAPCHSAMLVKVEAEKPSMPWEQSKPRLERRNIPCPDCTIPISVNCLGGHETSDLPCYRARPYSCNRLCGRLLICGNHSCTIECHLVESAPNSMAFWDWFIRVSDVRIHLKNQPTYLLSQLAYVIGGGLTLVHALVRGGRLPYLWLGIVVHGLVVEYMCYVLPDVDNFWHSQTSIMLLGRRLPLHIIFLYPCFIYNSTIAVAKMKLPLWAEPLAVGMGTVLIDIPYDIISVNFLHWTWHDTDPNIEDRHYWVPWNSYFFHLTFAASFSFWFHISRKYICNSNNKWTGDKSVVKEILCSIIAALLGTPGGILIFVTIYHPLHDIFKIHSEVTFFIIFAIALLIIWSADRTPKIMNGTHNIHWSTWLLVTHLTIHYATFLILPILFNPEDEVSIGLKEPIGPCDEFVPLQTAFGMILQKRKYLCSTDYDEKYFNWDCLPNHKPPSDGSSWYTACGVPFSNRAEMITVALLLALIAGVVFRNLHFKSYGDNVISTENDLTVKNVRKIKKR